MCHFEQPLAPAKAGGGGNLPYRFMEKTRDVTFFPVLLFQEFCLMLLPQARITKATGRYYEAQLLRKIGTLLADLHSHPLTGFESNNWDFGRDEVRAWVGYV